MKNVVFIVLLIFLFPFLGNVSSISSIPVLNEQINETVKILNYNIEESGYDPDWKEVIKEENPDIMVLVETGDWDDATNDGFGSSDF
ncbi:MAG: hypothetical protein KAT16_09345, partial [Candidatus Heimdallarchaeota archaeon]|nr:hypothetical protein [Candidatus Heimdallarchaeota archaeon]